MCKNLFQKIFSAVLMLVALSSCTSLFFYPQKNIVGTPDQIGINFENVSFPSSDGTLLTGWLVKANVPAAQRKGVVYFLHGNAENISTHFASVYWLPEQGYDVFLLDYRGYGESAGKPALPEVFDDIESGFVWLQKQYPPDQPFIFFGQSIGATMGIYWLAHNHDVSSHLNSIVLDAPFASYLAMVNKVLRQSWLTWLFAKPVSWCFSSRYDPINSTAALPSNIPVLFFHSPDDEVVPFEFSEKVYSAINSPKTEVITQGPHIATFNFPENRQALLKFLQR